MSPVWSSIFRVICDFAEQLAKAQCWHGSCDAVAPCDLPLSPFSDSWHSCPAPAAEMGCWRATAPAVTMRRRRRLRRMAAICAPAHPAHGSGRQSLVPSWPAQRPGHPPVSSATRWPGCGTPPRAVVVATTISARLRRMRRPTRPRLLVSPCTALRAPQSLQATVATSTPARQTDRFGPAATKPANPTRRLLLPARPAASGRVTVARVSIALSSRATTAAGPTPPRCAVRLPPIARQTKPPSAAVMATTTIAVAWQPRPEWPSRTLAPAKAMRATLSAAEAEQVPAPEINTARTGRAMAVEPPARKSTARGGQRPVPTTRIRCVAATENYTGMLVWRRWRAWACFSRAPARSRV